MKSFDIIICHEKHETVYWDAQTPEAWATSSLAILTQRWNEGFWYMDPDDDGLGTSEWADNRRKEQQEALALSSEELQKLPETARKAVLGLRGEARRESEEDRAYRQWYTLAKRVVDEQDAGMVTRGRNRYEHEIPFAWELLEWRSENDAQYERVSLEPLQRALQKDET